MLVLLLALAILVARAVLLWRERHDRTWRWWLGWSVPVLALVVVAVLFHRLGADIEATKFVAHLIMPAGLLWVALAGGAAWAAVRRRWKLAIAWSLLFLLETVAGNVWIGGLLMRGLESRVSAVDPSAGASYDAVVVCGGGTDPGFAGRSQITASGDRVLYAAELYLQGHARILVSTGTAPAGMEEARDMSEETASIWRRLGIPDADIMRIPGPRVTSEEIAAFQEVARREGWRRVGLVTSAWHMPRAQRLCARAQFTADALPCDRRSRMMGWSPVWLVPQEKGFQRVQLALWEYLGLLTLR